MFERELPEKIKDIWSLYYQDKPRALGMSIESSQMDLILRKFDLLT